MFRKRPARRDQRRRRSLHDEHDIATSHSRTTASEGCQRGNRHDFGGRRRRAGVRSVGRSGPHGKYGVNYFWRDVFDIDCDVGHDIDNDERHDGALEPDLDCGVEHLDVHREVDRDGCGGHSDRGRDDCVCRHEWRELVLVEQTPPHDSECGS